MKYVQTLLSVSLIVGTFHVQAETNCSGNPMAVAPSPEMQVAHSNHVGATAQAKDAKVPAPSSQAKVSSQNHTYEVPLGDYNNDGHFGN